MSGNNKERDKDVVSWLRNREELNGSYILIIFMPTTCLLIAINGSYLRPMLLCSVCMRTLCCINILCQYIAGYFLLHLHHSPSYIDKYVPSYMINHKCINNTHFLLWYWEMVWSYIIINCSDRVLKESKLLVVDDIGVAG